MSHAEKCFFQCGMGLTDAKKKSKLGKRQHPAFNLARQSAEEEKTFGHKDLVTI